MLEFLGETVCEAPTESADHRHQHRAPEQGGRHSDDTRRKIMAVNGPMVRTTAGLSPSGNIRIES